MREVGPRRSRRRHRAPLIVLVLAALAQAAVLFFTLVAGLSWGGWSHAAALLQALLLFGVLLVLTARRSWLTPLVPVISVVISLVLFLFFVRVESDAACTSEIRETTAQVRPLPGTRVTLNGEVESGCIARFTVPTSRTDSVLPHYRREFTRHGWKITAEERDALVAIKDGIVMNVEVPEGEPGIGSLVIILVDDRS